MGASDAPFLFQEVIMVAFRVPLVSPTAAPRAGGRHTSALVRVGGVAAVLAGVVMGVHEWWDDRVPGIQEGVLPSALHATWMVTPCSVVA